MEKDKEYEKQVGDYVKRVLDGKPDCKLSEEDVKTLKSKMLQSLEIDVQQLVSTEKFVSGLVLRMPIIPIRDCRCSTASTDGTNIYFDIDFYTRLTREERIFVIAHEVWHNALLHFLRRENRERDLWNIATDCEINYALKQEGFVMPTGLCYPNSEDEGKCAEDIYDVLLKKQRKSQKNSGSQQGQQGQSSGGYTKTGKDPRNAGSNGQFKDQFDDHVDKSTQDEEYGEHAPDDGKSFRAPSDKWGEKGFDDDFKPCVSDSAADRIREMVISEAQRYERTKGSVPAGIRHVIDSICKPEIRWEELLSQFVTSCLGDRRQWLPPHRRGVYNELYFQSRRGEKINVSCIVDTSGSTEADIPKFLAELVSLLETFGRYELTIIHCDCKVHRVDTFDDSNPFPVDTPLDYTFDGGGGSDLNPAFDRILEMGIEPTCNIVFTDGYIDCPSTNPLDIPTLFVLTSDGHEDLCDWGTKMKFKEKVQRS